MLPAIPDPLLGSAPNLLGIFLGIATGALIFFWRRRSEQRRRESVVTRTQNLIWSSVLNATDDLDPDTLEPFEADELDRRDLEQRRFISSDAEEEIRAYLDEVVEPMTAHDRIAELDKSIQKWNVRACLMSLAASGWALLLIIVSYFWPLYASLKVLSVVPLLIGIGICAYQVLRCEIDFSNIHDRYKHYRG